MALAGAMVFGATTQTANAADDVPVDRRELPIKTPWIPPITTFDARDAKAPPVFQVEAPEGAPNVVIVLIDDLGFGGTSTFGGVIPTPTFDRLAAGGLKYNQMHSTALCSPSRAALLTGRNHHTVNMGSITELATSFPGNTGMMPADCAMLPETLRLNGYSTAHFGKDHMTATWETSPSGPMTRWPTFRGFDRFYGFLGGETNQWSPMIYDDLAPVDDPAKGDPDYHFMNDMTEKAIEWIEIQQSLTPDKPFFVYFAPGATHAPHHVPQSYIDKYKGQFDDGWDVIRERIFNQQKKMGVIPAGTKLAGKPEAIKDWDDLSAKEQKLFARQAEVFAAFVDMTDYEIGRLVDAIDEIGELDNTLIVYIAGDNGTSAEGGMNGLYSEMTYFNNVPETVDDMMEYYDVWGGPETYPHMAAGWAVCFDSPFMWTKQVPANYGGTRQGTVMHWPNRIQANGELRTQWHHFIDVAPTVLEAIGLPEPRIVNGVGQRPIEGVSMAYTWDDANAADRHHLQYFEILGNRGLYNEGWFAGTVHKAPWEAKPRHPLTEDVWELYHVAEDFSMTEDLSKQYPDKLKELQELFLAEAVKYQVLPIDDRFLARIDAKSAGRPDLMGDRTSLTLYEGAGFLMENSFIDTKNTSFSITAKINADGEKTNGVLVSQGGRFGGWSFYIKNGKPAYLYNFLGMEHYSVMSNTTLPSGDATVTLEFAYDGGSGSEPKIGAGGMATLLINGKKVGSAEIEKTQCCIWSADESANVGIDRETQVSPDYHDEHSSRFNGRIHEVTIDLK